MKTHHYKQPAEQDLPSTDHGVRYDALVVTAEKFDNNTK